MTMAHTLDEGVLSLSIRLEGAHVDGVFWYT
jgi:hypothetical protein